MLNYLLVNNCYIVNNYVILPFYNKVNIIIYNYDNYWNNIYLYFYLQFAIGLTDLGLYPIYASKNLLVLLP